MGVLYKGFIRTKGKEPIEKYKGKKKFHTYEEIKDADSFAGVLCDDSICIDIDDKHQSDILMDIIEANGIRCRVTQTKRGRHFTFKNDGVERCKTGTKLACGLTADIKTGGNPEVLKVDGEERFCEWGNDDPEYGEYDQLPAWLKPVNTNMDFFNTVSRNSDFFSYILVLQSQLAMTNDECKSTIRIINDYVLSEPLDADELEIILRDESFEKPMFFEGKKFLHDAFGDWLINQRHIKRINGQLHVYIDGVYLTGYRVIENTMLKAFPQMKDSQRKEVLKYLEVMRPDEEAPADARYIAFKNGIWDIVDKKLIDFTPDINVTNQIPWNYDPSAYSEIVDNMLNRLACGDEIIRHLLEECIGYTFYRRSELSVAMFLTGEKSNGKSTFLTMLQDLLGNSNVSNLGLDELDERFSVALMASKLANIGDDISDEFLHGKSIAHFKKIVSGNWVKAEHKGQDGFFFKPTVKLIFSANQIPRMKDRTGAVLRRMVIIPFNARFSSSDPDHDPHIVYKLKDRRCMEYLIQLGLAGLERIIDQKGFSKSPLVDAEIEDYKEYNNPVLSFIKSIELDDILHNETRAVHSQYELFCHDNGFQMMGLANFTKEINRQLDLRVRETHMNGKKVRLFERI